MKDSRLNANRLRQLVSRELKLIIPSVSFFLESGTQNPDVVAMDFGEKLFQGLPEDAAKDQKVIDAYLGVSG